MNRERKPGWGFWLTIALIVLPVLYIVSSGPARMIACRSTLPWSYPVVFNGSGGKIRLWKAVEEDHWWRVTYRPLVWVTEQRWGTPLVWYWDLFPIRGAKPQRWDVYFP